jgi:hypothetical protein
MICGSGVNHDKGQRVLVGIKKEGWIEMDEESLRRIDYLGTTSTTDRIEAKKSRVECNRCANMNLNND